MSALLLIIIGGFILAVLVQRTDNAYLGLALVSLSLLAVSCPFALAALIPYGGIRRAVVILGIALLWAVAAFDGLMLISTLVIIFQQYAGPSALFVRHLVGLVFVVFATYVAGYRLTRGAGRLPTAQKD
ncbi:MAG: hypothetical protein HYY30_00900 [Chloroflexi bacterium]|nr:hypothetical protein [Chloroflexota bacterium]